MTRPPAADVEKPGETHKARGNELLKAGEFREAAAAYGLAIEADASVPAYWSNRSHALLRAEDAAGALRDADEAVKLQPGWAKAHYRRAQALKELGRPHEAAQACAAGLEVVATEAEKKELRKLHEVMASASAAIALSGWWHGKVSAELGGFDQEFCFLAEGQLMCCVYGQELTGEYILKDVEASSDGKLRGGVNVDLNGQKVPYLFRVDGNREMLRLCCPMASPPERPRTFDGPGFVGMGRGRVGGADALEGLSEGQRVFRYLTELIEAMEARLPPDTKGDSGIADKLLEEFEGGGTVNSNQLVGPASLEDKSKQMANDNMLQALRLKYTESVAEAAERLIKGEAVASAAHPAEAKDLERLLRRFKKAGEEEREEKEEQPQLEDAPAATPEPELPVSAAAPAPLVPASAPAPEPASPAPASAAAAREAPKAPKAAAGGGCCGGCFAAFRG